MFVNKKVIALGFFDGVHLGHAALLRRTVEEAKTRGVISAVFTFDRVPKEVITGVPCPMINSPTERINLLRKLYGIQEVIMVPFDDEMRTTAWDKFVTEILEKRYHAVHLVAGHDHHFGYRNQGSPELLRKKCAEMGIGCDIIPKVEMGDTVVSSTHIRKLLGAGKIESANQFLGHPHILTVCCGSQTKYTIGVPTIELIPTSPVLIPAFGVYATQMILSNQTRHVAVVNIGSRTTQKEGSTLAIEAWIPDLRQDLRGETVQIEFNQSLRGHILFSMSELNKEYLSRHQ